MKNKTKAIIAAIVSVIVVAIIVILVIALKPASHTKTIVVTNANGENVTDKDGKLVTKVIDEKDETTKDPWAGVEIVEETTKDPSVKNEKNNSDNKADGKKSNKKDNKKDSDDGEQSTPLYKRDKNGKIVTKKNGEKVTRKEAYPGEADGWSPIVSPDELENK